MLTAPLSDIGFLASASPGLRDMVTELAVKTPLKAGEVLFSQGDQGDALYAIISGELEASAISASGKKLGLDIMRQGDLFGEIALFSPGPRTATMTAITDSEVWGLRNADVLKALKSSPDLYIDMIELAGMRLRWISAQFHERAFMDVTTRLARRLIHLSAEGQRPLSMSHADLATFIGATRESTSKTLSAWKRSGLIELGRGTITVIDIEGLKKLAESDLI